MWEPLNFRWKQFHEERLTVRLLGLMWTTLQQSGSPLSESRRGPVLVEFADYQCPYCRSTNSAIDSAVGAGLVTVRYIHFPLAIHPAADGAARTAVCAEAQGRFRQVHSLLMTTVEWQDKESWVNVAKAAGVPDLPQFEYCLYDSSTTVRLDVDRELGQQLHVSGTPTFFTRTGRFSGAISLRDLTRKMR
jgi:protein-disulfide isomerase